MPTNYDDQLSAAGKAYDLDPRLIKTVMQIESSGGVNNGKSLPNDPDSPTGLMQIRPSTAKSLGITDPNDPKQAIPAAAKYLRQGLEATGSPEGALAYYFGGPDHSLWGPKTAGYVAHAQSLYPKMQLSNAPAETPESKGGQAIIDDLISPPQPTEQSIGGQKLIDSIINPTPEAKPAPTPSPESIGGQKLIDSIAPPNPTPSAPSSTFATSSPPPEQQLHETGTYDDYGRPVYMDGNGNPTVPPTTTGQNYPLESGLVRGVRDVIDPITKYGSYFFGSTPQDVGDSNLAARTASESQYSGNPLYTTGRVGGQIAATAPLMGAVNPLVGKLAGGIGIPEGITTALTGGAGGAGSVGSRVAQFGSRTAQGALIGGEAGALTTGQSDEPILTQVGKGALAGGVGGAALPLVAEGGARLWGGTTSLPANIAEAVRNAQTKYGIGIRATQVPEAMPGNSALGVLNALSSVVPGSGAGNETAQTLNQWRAAVAKVAGLPEGSTRLTGPALDTANETNRAILQKYENRQANMYYDGKPQNDYLREQLGNIVKTAKSNLGPADAANVENLVNGILDPAGDTVGIGKGYQNGRMTYSDVMGPGSALHDAIYGGSASNPVKSVAQQIRETTRNTIHPRPGDPVDEYLVARNRQDHIDLLRNVPKDNLGNISPPDLKAAVNAPTPPMPPRPLTYGVSGAQDTQGNLKELSDIGDYINPAKKDFWSKFSGVLQHGLPSTLIDAVGVPIATALGFGPHAAGVVGTQAAARATGTYLRSQGLMNRLTTSALKEEGPNVVRGQSGVPGMLSPYTGIGGNEVGNALTSSPSAPAPVPAPAQGNQKRSDISNALSPRAVSDEYVVPQAQSFEREPWGLPLPFQAGPPLRKPPPNAKQNSLDPDSPNPTYNTNKYDYRNRPELDQDWTKYPFSAVGKGGILRNIPTVIPYVYGFPHNYRDPVYDEAFPPEFQNRRPNMETVPPTFGLTPFNDIQNAPGTNYLQNKLYPQRPSSYDKWLDQEMDRLFERSKHPERNRA